MQNYEPRRRKSKYDFQNIYLHNNNNHNFINNFNNYTMKKAIAMKCNKEQFEAVRHHFCKKSIQEFSEKDYLTNLFCGTENYIANVTMIIWGKEIHETWNEKVFLEACGIEPTFAITKETILKYEMKDEFPSVFKKELVVGKWYKYFGN